MSRDLLTAAVILVLIISGCSYPHFYNTPVAQNVPLHDTCNEFTVIAAGGLGAVNQSFEAQASYSFPMNIALSASCLAGGTSHKPDGIEDYSRVRYFEGAIGYYKPFAENCSFELYGGYGQGTQKHAFAYNEYQGSLIWTWIKDGTADISFSRIFIQPDIGVKYEWLDAAFSCRLSRLNFDDIAYAGTFYRTAELTNLEKHSRMMLLEPAFTVRAGSPMVKIHFQLVLSANLTGKDLLTETTRVNFGISFTLGGHQAKKPPSFTPKEPPLSGK